MDFTWENIAAILYKIARDPDDLVPVILCCMLADAVSVYFWLVRCRRGHGASGLAGVTWILYAILILMSRESILFRQQPVALYKLLDFVVLTLFHSLCHFIVPHLYTSHLTKKTLLSLTKAPKKPRGKDSINEQN
jgi:hypothetical protein